MLLATMPPYRLPIRHSPCVRLLLLTVCVGGISGCSTLGYYAQAVHGHVWLLQQRRPIDVALADPALPATTRRKLELARTAREFARRELGLPDNGSYRSYSDLKRDFVVWNVFAAPEFSLEPVPSCFLIVGCLSYRGYFDRNDARDYADTLRQQGFDVYVGGVAAYSTLGWCDDPVLNTILRWEDARIVKVIFHELAHQLLYVNGDSVFNESFATAVAAIGYARWKTRHAALIAPGEDENPHEDELLKLIMARRAELAALYRQPLAADLKRARKEAILRAIVEDYTRLKASWGGNDHFDQWVLQDLNNAKLASVATYNDDVPAFVRLLDLTDQDLPRFYAAVKALAAQPKPQRDRCLETLLAQHDAALPACLQTP